jgi:hypothetical protein
VEVEHFLGRAAAEVLHNATFLIFHIADHAEELCTGVRGRVVLRNWEAQWDRGSSISPNLYAPPQHVGSLCMLPDVGNAP